MTRKVLYIIATTCENYWHLLVNEQWFSFQLVLLIYFLWYQAWNSMHIGRTTSCNYMFFGYKGIHITLDNREKPQSTKCTKHILYIIRAIYSTPDSHRNEILHEVDIQSLDIFCRFQHVKYHIGICSGFWALQRESGVSYLQELWSTKLDTIVE